MKKLRLRGGYIVEGKYFLIEHAPLKLSNAGTVIVESRTHLLDFGEMTSAESAELGSILKRLVPALKIATGAHRIYFLALGVLSQHLIVLLDPVAIVQTMHDAYDRIELTADPYGVFLAGPSATGDIEGVMVRGAQGARSLTVLFMSDPR